MNFRLPILRWRNWLTSTITRKLWLAFLSVFLLTYLITALVVLSAVRTSLTSTQLATLSQFATIKLNNLAEKFDQLATTLHAWSKLDVMNDLASRDVDRRVALALENLKTDYRFKGDLFAFDSSGYLVASSQRKTDIVSLPEIWQATGSSVAFIDKHISPVNGSEIVVLTTPVVSAFSPALQLGTLVLVYPWSEIRAALSAKMVLLRQGAPPTLLATALDEVQSPETLSTLATREGWINVQGARYLASGSSQESSLLAGWHIIALSDAESIDGPLRRVAVQLSFLCLVLAIPLTLTIRWLSYRMTAPLRELKRVVSEITQTGDLTQRVALPSRDELGALATAFNLMAARMLKASQEREQFVHQLELSAQDLENKVRKRTEQLTKANNESKRTLDNLRAAQSQLIQQEKMASLGQLVAGVAHEINNPIGFIYANFPHLEEYVVALLGVLDEFHQMPMPAEVRLKMEKRLAAADLDFLREDLLKIIRSGKSGAFRVKEIISSLRSFSRLDEAVLKAAALEDGLEDTLGLLQHHLRNRIEVTRDYQLNVPVLCRPGQLNQVFMNVLYNAIQAIEGPGTISVRTYREDHWAVVAITDSGSGIASDLQHRIFDPFFTTKKVGEGTGLGLSISYGIIKNHGGHIDVNSEPGRGATFTIYLPVTHTSPADQPHTEVLHETRV